MTESQDANSPILQALRRRRSMPVMRPDAPARPLVEEVLAAATWAPNHHRTEPWRFVVLEGAAREAFGEFLAETRGRKITDVEGEEGQRLLQKERHKPLRAPVVVVAAAVPTSHPKAQRIEEIEAVAAGVQNMLLTAESLGLGAMWRTGWPAYSDEVKRYLGLPEDADIVAFLYLGYPAVPGVPRERGDARPFTTWLD